MTREEKYRLDRALIELDNAIHELDVSVDDLIEYCHQLEIRQVFDNLMDSPMNKIQVLLDDIKGGNNGTECAGDIRD